MLVDCDANEPVGRPPSAVLIERLAHENAVLVEHTTELAKALLQQHDKSWHGRRCRHAACNPTIALAERILQRMR